MDKHNVSQYYPDHRISPVAIQSAACVYHLSTVEPAHARVLEIGCGEGGCITAHALAYPESQVMGIDIDESLIAAGQRHTQALGLSNIELFSAGLGDILATEGGQFDYIVIRGVFSLLGRQEREALLLWCRQNLSASGVVCLHWYPSTGEPETTAIREALSYHAARGANADPESQVNAARGMLSYLAMTLPEGTLKAQVEEAEKESDLALTLRYLSQTTAALSFTEFCHQVSDLGLHYAGDAVPQYELPRAYGEKVATLHALVAGQQRIAAQQYLDFAVSRTERFSLLSATITEEHFPALPDSSCLESLYWAGNFSRKMNENGAIYNGHIGGNGQQSSSENPITLRILDLLGAAWPFSLSVEQLVINCRKPEDNTDVREAVLKVLEDLYLTQPAGLYWRCTPGAYDRAENDTLQPILSLKNGVPEGNASQVYRNLWGDEFSVTPEEWRYLQHGLAGVDAEAWQCFMSLRKKGALTGSPTAWKKHYQLFLRTGKTQFLLPLLNNLLLLSVSISRGGLLSKDVNDLPQRESEHTEDTYDRINRLIREKKIQDAKTCAEKLLKENPEDIAALRCYSRTLVLSNRWDEAKEVLCRLMGHYFSSLDIYYDLATGLQKTNQHYYAILLLQGLLRLEDKNVNFWHSLAYSYYQLGEMSLAEKCSRVSLRCDEVKAIHYATMGVILSDSQKLDEAAWFLNKAIALEPSNFDYFTALLFAMTHDHKVTAEQLYQKHLQYGETVGAWAAACHLQLPYRGIKNPDKKLRVGFVSGDLRKHPVSHFLAPFWDGLDRNHFELVGYSTSYVHDEVTEHFAAGSVLWRQVDKLSNQQLAEQVYHDGIDILFDLSGHTSDNRLPAFALRPAPVQISWIGYPGTTGLKTMDYRIVTATLAEPADLEQQLTESIMFIEMRKFFEPDPQSPDIETLPALKNGYLTFGSFNRPKKINDEVLRVWASILAQSPDAKFVIGFMNDEKMVAEMTRKLELLGIAPSRLIFKKRAPLLDYLAYHNEIDILLDAFPYSGGTTSNHACWMGVPTLTLCGATMAARQGVDIMRIHGLENFIAYGEEDYIQKALSWRDRLPELNEIRMTMRERMPAETADGFNVAGTFGRALREAWRIYCAGEAHRTFTVLE
nr:MULTISPECIES: bifunctional class I SAM-dependent methyltransferase/glycosyltransferase [unclassified Enterobacter]